MGKKLTALVLAGALLCGVAFVGCSSGGSDSGTSPSAVYSIVGPWGYVLISQGNTWDQGTITFSGSDTSGTYAKTNFYGITYNGSYSVNGTSVTISEEGATWTGTFASATMMNGTWTAGDDSGTWTAAKQ